MARGEAHYAANSRLAFSHADTSVLHVYSGVWHVFLQRGEIIFKDECGAVLRITHPASAWVPRAKVAGWIVARTRNRRNGLDRALPGTLRAMRRNQYPLIC